MLGMGISFSYVSHSNQQQNDYFTCAGQLLDVISNVRALVNTVDDLDYKYSALTQCDPTIVNCERVRNEIKLSKQTFESEILHSKQLFIKTVDFCLDAKPTSL